jgi:hypothetical protein
MAAQQSIARTPAGPSAGGWPRNAARQWLVVAAVAILALNGVDLVYRSLAGGPAVEGAGARAATTFGSIAISAVETVDGLSAADLGGMTHGVSGLVPATQAEVLVGIVITNASDRRVRIDPAAFGLVVDGADPLPASGGTLIPVGLSPGADLEARIAFVVPRTAATATLRYADPGGGSVALAAGQIVTGPAPNPAPEDGHDH